MAELQEGGADQLHAAVARGQELLHNFQVFQLGVRADLLSGGWGEVDMQAAGLRGVVMCA